MNIGGQRSNVGTDLRFWCGAPGRIRTRDPLLRRQLLCPAELRALERNCARGRSRDGYMMVAVCRPLTSCHLGKRHAASPPRTPQPPRLPHPAVSRRVPPGRQPNYRGARSPVGQLRVTLSLVSSPRERTRPGRPRSSGAKTATPTWIGRAGTDRPPHPGTLPNKSAPEDST